MKKPLVSIIMPTYNRPTTLKRAIDSCLDQTYGNIEVVVIDDNNPDTVARKETIKLMKQYDNNSKVNYIKQDANRGACIARNKGIECCKGEYVTFLDDDDEYFPNNIEKEIEHMTKNKLDMIFCNQVIINDITKTKITKKYYKNFDYTKEGLLRKHLVDIIAGGIAFIYKKSVLIEIGCFYDIPASQEYILMLNTILGGYKIRYYDFSGTLGHSHSGNDGITGSLKAIEAKKEVIKLVKPHLHFLKFSDQRKVMFRLNLFLLVQYIRKKNIESFYYFLKIIPYLDLLILKIFKNDKPKVINGVMYI